MELGNPRGNPRTEVVKTPEKHYAESLRAAVHATTPPKARTPAPRRPLSRELSRELRGASAETERIRTPPKSPGSVSSDTARALRPRRPPVPRQRPRRPTQPLNAAVSAVSAVNAFAKGLPAAPLPPSPRPAPPPAPPRPAPPDRTARVAALLVALIAASLHYAPAYRATVDRYLGITRERGVSALLYLVPLGLLMGYDAAHNPLHRFFPFPDRWANYVLRVAGGYGIVQVLAQDLGLKTGALQRDLIENGLVQLMMLWGGAFAVTGRRSEGLVSALLYFVLKHHVSAGETSRVCFEDV
jgi:hypothetical protein